MSRLWTCLESKSDFLALFPNGTPHQLRYDSDLDYEPDPELDELAPADFPICRITYEKAEPNLDHDSDNSLLAVRFRIEVATGEQKQRKLMDATWAIFRGYSTFMTNMVGAVDWGGKIVHLQDEAIEVTDQDKERNRGTNQWIGLHQCLAVMYFPTTTIAST